MEIKNISTLVQPILKNGAEFISAQCRNLLAPGENYGSIMVQVEIKTSNADGSEEIIHCVAKTTPPPGFLWEVFNTKVTFKKEIALYNKIIPLLNNFGRERGIKCLIDFVADCKAARISIDPTSDEVDENAVLLMENLKFQGYDVGDRFVGFDFDTTKFLLRDLATLHASVIAYKLAKPAEFQAKVLPYLSKHPVIDVGEDVERNGNESMMGNLSIDAECVPHLPKLKIVMSNMKEMMQNPPKTKEIFTTLTHNDYWINNTMIKFENGKVVSNKMVDFQIIEHTSLANDIIFFLYSSVELSVLEIHLDYLLKYYYEEFIAILQKLGCDVSPYTFEAMMDEFAIIGKNIQLMHILFMLLPMMTLKGKVKDLANMELADILVDKTSLHENYYKRLKFVFLDFVKREWL